jgi:plastocyanin
VLSLGTKSLLGLAVVAFAGGLVYGIATSEQAGTTLLLFVATGAVALAAVSVAAGPDRTPVPSGEGPLPQNPPAGPRPAFPSVWPLVAAIAVVLFGIAAATNWIVVVVAVVVAALAGAGWLLQEWSEHPIFTARFGQRLQDRFLVPLGLPLAVVLLVLLIALSLSRVLLAVPEQASRGVALAVAVVILSGAFFVASQERMARAALSLLSALALVAVVAAGAVGLAHGERHFVKKGVVAGGPAASASIASVDNQLAFNTGSLQFPAGQPVNLSFDNQSTGLPHNVGIYDQAGGKELFQGKIVTGPAKVTYAVTPLAAGTYYFQCDVHPVMHGTLTVGAASAGSAATAAAPTTTAPTSVSPTTTIAVSAGFATTATTAP